MILYLDYDGVLHPDNVRLVQYGYGEPRMPEMVEPGFTLFCWAHVLERILMEVDPQARVQIVLSTSWVNHFGEFAAEYLPAELKNRVVGIIKHSQLPRGELIAMHAEQNGFECWIAIDDDDLDWPEDHRHRLVRCDPMHGLSAQRVVDELRIALKELL